MGFYKCQNDKMATSKCDTCKYVNDITHRSECYTCINAGCSMDVTNYVNNDSCTKCLYKPKTSFRLIDKDFLDDYLLPKDVSGGMYGFGELQEILECLDANCMKIVFCKDCVHKLTENCPMYDAGYIYTPFGFCYFGEDE